MQMTRFLPILAFLLFSQHAQAGWFKALFGLESAKEKKSRVIRKNAKRGAEREKIVAHHLTSKHFLSSIQNQPVLLNSKGKPAIDPQTKQSRRFDFAVITPFGRVKRLVEVTSLSASKKAQRAKTERIFSRYKNLYIKDKRNGNLVKISKSGFLKTSQQTIRLR